LRKKTVRRYLVASGRQPFEPTDELRKLVSVLVFNGTSEARIAEGLGLDLVELRYYFANELGYSTDRILAGASATIIELSKQRADLGVALKAASLMVQTRLSVWREPRPEAPKPPAEARIGSLTLDEVERELARLATGAAAAGAPPADDQG
jgi:hypothetical protein